MISKKKDQKDFESELKAIRDALLVLKKLTEEYEDISYPPFVWKGPPYYIKDETLPLPPEV